MSFLTPNIFNRLSPSRWRHALGHTKELQPVCDYKVSQQSVDPTTQIVVYKGDDDDFSLKCRSSARQAAQVSQKLLTLTVAVRFFSAAMGACAGIIVGLASWPVGIAVGVGSGILSIVDLAFAWGSQVEKYARISTDLLALSLSGSDDREMRYERIRVLFESWTLSSDTMSAEVIPAD